MIRKGSVAGFVFFALAPSWASGWTAQNLLDVQPVGADVIEVIGRPGSGPAQYWCGAGDYFRRAKGFAGGQRIYIWRAVGPSETRPGRTAVQFALTAPAGADTTTGYALTIKRAGDNLSAALAQQYCWGQRAIDP